MYNLFDWSTVNLNELYGDYYLEAKKLYLYHFRVLPNNFYIGNIDGQKAFEAFKKKFSANILRVYQYRWYQARTKSEHFGSTLLLLDNHCLIEFDNNECDIWHNGETPGFIKAITELIDPFKERQRREPLEINLVVRNNNRLELKGMEIKKTKLNLDLFYGEEFRETDELIRKRLNKKRDKGIVLLHGLPGSGKTTYLRYLIGKIKKRVLFLSPSVAEDLMSPHFIELLTSNPDTVVIIEDAENVIMDRKHSPRSAVSNLLNISDGLLADFLNVQLICTFNNSLALIDNALLRKGRLIAKYEFGKLSIAQSQRLSDHLGFHTAITKPMTVAEIAGQHEKEQKESKTEVIGFRRQTIEN